MLRPSARVSASRHSASVLLRLGPWPQEAMAYIGFPEPSPSSQLRLFAGRRRAFSQKSAPMSLFRPEATERHSQRLTGSVSMAVPIGWHLAGYLMAGALFLALMFVSLASYSRIVTA